MKIAQKLCKSQKKYNEDFIGYKDNYAYVLDGATGLKYNIISETSDAHWYVTTFASYLERYLQQENVKQAVKKALKDISIDISKYSHNIISKLDIPSSCIALVKENDDNYEFFVLGDCSIIYGDKEHQTLVTNEELKKLDAEKIKKMVSIAKEREMDVIDAYEFIISDLQQQRLLKNSSNGYYILDVDEVAVEHATYKVVPKSNIEMILILSDGFSSYYDCLNLTKNYKSFFLKNYDTNIEELYKQLRDEEQQDKTLNKHPRFKVSDDASIIKLKCN